MIRARGPVFVFSGHGSQWWGMERELREHEPVFAASLRACDEILQDLVGWSLLERLTDRSTRRLFAAGGEVTQPAIFSMQVSLAALWRSWGVLPCAVVGHSLGEIAAAHEAGSLSLGDALRIVVLRNEALRESQRIGGGMAVVRADRAEVERRITCSRGRVFCAGSNGPAETLLAGYREELALVVNGLRSSGYEAHLLRADGMAHCPLLDELGRGLAQRIGQLEARSARVEFYSSVTGDRLAALGASQPGYWGRNLRQPVRFSDAMGALARDGHGLYLELGPHPLTASAVAACCRELGREAQVLSSMHRERPPRAFLGEVRAALRALGVGEATPAPGASSELILDGPARG